MIVKPLTPSIGAEVRNLDVSAVAANAELTEAVRQAFLAHHVLVFRDQELDRTQHKTFGRLFGRLHVHPSRRNPSFAGDPEIFTVKAGPDTVRNNGGRWHTDVSCEEVPPLGSLLLLKEAPPEGGDTLFANMHLAFDTLSNPIKQLLLGCLAHHDGLQDLRWYGLEPDSGLDYPATSHPVVVVHPETGKPLLNVNEAFTSHILGLERHESDAILAMLFAHISRSPAIQCRVRWEPGTLVFWDNRCVQHFAVWDYHPHVRRGERVSVRGAIRPQAADPDRCPIP